MPIFGIYLFKEKFQLFIPYAYTYKIIVTKKRYMIIMIFSRDLGSSLWIEWLWVGRILCIMYIHIRNMKFLFSIWGFQKARSARGFGARSGAALSVV